mmetsp:Transcript_32699/g.81987  ORF Transcript_32699/g.81987 Transcript_32699/m.81987 type:complete len:328 (+) Transcript_32699:1290-2273(+)
MSPMVLTGECCPTFSSDSSERERATAELATTDGAIPLERMWREANRWSEMDVVLVNVFLMLSSGPRDDGKDLRPGTTFKCDITCSITCCTIGSSLVIDNRWVDRGVCAGVRRLSPGVRRENDVSSQFFTRVTPSMNSVGRLAGASLYELLRGSWGGRLMAAPLSTCWGDCGSLNRLARLPRPRSQRVGELMMSPSPMRSRGRKMPLRSCVAHVSTVFRKGRLSAASLPWQPVHSPSLVCVVVRTCSDSWRRRCWCGDTDSGGDTSAGPPPPTAAAWMCPPASRFSFTLSPPFFLTLLLSVHSDKARFAPMGRRCVEDFLETLADLVA